MTIDQKRDLTRIFLNDAGLNPFYPNGVINKVIEETEILHVLVAVKLLSKIDGVNFEIPSLSDLNNLITEIVGKKDEATF